jgi:citrate lyase beta subunit
MPGDDIRKIRKATTLRVDCICMDMEDGVALNRKSAARQTIVEAVQMLDFGSSERLVRINAIGSGLENEDLEAALSIQPDGIVVPKVDEGEQIRWVSAQIAAAEASNGWPRENRLDRDRRDGGIVNLPAIALSRSASAGADLQAEDLAGDIRRLAPEGREVFYALNGRHPCGGVRFACDRYGIC